MYKFQNILPYNIRLCGIANSDLTMPCCKRGLETRLETEIKQFDNETI